VVLSPVPLIALTKTATPGNLPAPGGSFHFAVVVRNTGAAPVTITTLTDDKYGDLTSATNPKVTNNTCAGTSPPGAVGKVLDADTDGTGPLVGGSYSCGFDAKFTGAAGDSQTDVVTSTATDSNGTTVTAKDDATVTITPKTTPPAETEEPVTTPKTTTSPTVEATTLARTGASLGGLLTLAVGLLAAGGLLLLAGSSWAPAVQGALAGASGHRRRHA